MENGIHTWHVRAYGVHVGSMTFALMVSRTQTVLDGSTVHMHRVKFNFASHRFYVFRFSVLPLNSNK